MIWILEMMMYMLDFLKGDKFVPFGETDVELMEEGELIYSVGDMVKTRRWIWRQGEEGKLLIAQKYIFSYRWFY